jgi:hypothetical protein
MSANWGIYSDRGAITQSTKYGSFSVFIEDTSFIPDDYYDSDKKSHVKIPISVINYITTLHEIVGHGRSLTLGRTGNVNNDDAIYFENLLLRIIGFGNIQRDGTKHADGHKIITPSKQPEFR